MDDGEPRGTGQNLDDIIDGIYHVAVEPSRVHELVTTWRRRFTDAAGAADASRRMEPHLLRAVDLLDRLHDGGPDAGLPGSAQESQPLLRADSAGTIVECNAAASRIYEVTTGDPLAALPLCAASQRALARAVAGLRASRGESNGALDLLRLNRAGTGELLTFSLRPVAAADGAPLVELRGAEIVCSDELRQVLTYTFELTATEAAVAALLIEGLSVNEIAAARNNTVGTVRVHVRSLLAKTETHNQAEFIRMAIGISAMLAAPPGRFGKPDAAPDARAQAGPFPTPAHRRALALPDGRELAYADFGAADGRVVLFLHDNILGDTWPAALANAATERGLRIVAPARPYFSTSSPYPARRGPLDVVVGDTRHLLEHLGIDDYVVLSRTTGSAFGAALALADPHRCRALVALSPALPFSKSGDYDHLNDHARFVALSARFQKTALLFACRAGEAFYRTAGARRYLKAVLARSAPDRALCDDPLVLRDLQHGCDFSDNYKGFYHELLGLQSHPFPRFDDIGCPVELIVGDLDSNNRRRQAERVAAGLRNFRVTVIPGAGALFFYTHGEIVLAALERYSP